MRVSIVLDLGAGGYVVRLSSPANWFWVVFDDEGAPMQLDEMHSETPIPFEAIERDAADGPLEALFAWHLKCLGY